jgi:hypothetical protein
MSQIVMEIFEGAIIVKHAGEKKVFDRHETGKLTINLEDSPDATKPDTKEWTEFAPATSYMAGKQIDEPEGQTTFRNNQYTVTVVDLEGGAHYLTIKRNDRHWARDWRHFQRIKNELLGPEVEAVELYPAESRLVDEANQFHLWALAEGERFPLGFTDRSVLMSSDEEHGSKQRPVQDES